MVNTELLEERIVKSGKIRTHLSEKMGISRAALRLKIKNENEFTANEIMILCEELGITKLSDKERIFFAKEVEKKGNIA